MTPGDAPGPTLKQHAAGVLGLEPEARPGETLAALFRKLGEEDFLPDPLAHQAILALAGRQVGRGSLLAEDQDRAEEKRLGGEVERFAADFFSIPIAGRVERFKVLANDCRKHNRLLGRLHALKVGLAVDRKSATGDSSRAVNQLAEDMLALFVLRPEPRGVQARERLARFLSDPDLKDSDRSKASNRLQTAHPAVAALMPNYLLQLAKPHRPPRKQPVGSQIASKLHTTVADSPRSYIWVLVILISGLSRLATSSRTSTPPPPPPPPVIKTFTFPTTPGQPSPFSPPTIPGQPSPVPAPTVAGQPLPSPPTLRTFPKPSQSRPTPAIAANIRNDFKAAIRRELAAIGKTIDDPQLASVVAGLPVEELPGAGGMPTLCLLGLWTVPLRDRFAGELIRELQATDLGLTDGELELLAPRCFPRPSGSGPP